MIISVVTRRQMMRVTQTPHSDPSLRPLTRPESARDDSETDHGTTMCCVHHASVPGVEWRTRLRVGKFQKVLNEASVRSN